MSVLDSVYVGLFGMSVVFIVLLGLSLLVRAQTALITRVTKKRPKETASEPVENQSIHTGEPEPLQLINVDEKMAALVMAIICDEMKAQPDELRFKYIKKLPDEK